MPTVVVEVNGRVVQTYERSSNKRAFEHAWNLSKQYANALSGRGHYEIYVVTQECRIGKVGSVIQMDMDGNVVEIYKDSHEAYYKTGVHYSNILKASRGDKKSAGGFRWKRVG